MICLLCFGVEHNENLIDIVSAESRRQNIASTLHTHFRFCFQEKPVEGYVCQKCWVKVSVFHEFYTHIECVHRTTESIFVESITDDIKLMSNADSDSDKWVQDIPLDRKSLGEKPVTVPTRKSGRCHKGKLKKSKYYDSDHGANDSFGADFEDSSEQPTPRTAELPVPDSGRIGADSNQPRHIIVNESIRKKKKSVLLKDYKSDETDDEHKVDDEYFDQTTCNEFENTEQKKIKNRRPRRTKSGTYKCKDCKTHFLTFRRFERHNKQLHNIKEFKCKISQCVESFETQKLLDDHIEEKHKRTECPQCKKSFFKTGIANHIRWCCETSVVICELCGKVSPNKHAHAVHLKRAHDARDSFQCDICKKRYKNLMTLRAHMHARHVHGPQTCDICGHVSPSRPSAITHQLVHKPDSKDRYKCDICGRGFRQKNKLEEHYHIHTGTAGSHHCDECGQLFRFSSAFSVHKKKMHPK